MSEKQTEPTPFYLLFRRVGMAGRGMVSGALNSVMNRNTEKVALRSGGL